MIEDLIYDVGAHVGHDTAYYLHRGFRVVAVEANPHSVARLRDRFAAEIADRRLTIVDRAVTETGDFIDLCISASDSGSCSTLEDEVDDISERVPVRCCRFGEILEEFGVPFYLKIDIQGADMYCLKSLKPDRLPRFVSWELDREQLACLELMRGLGFREFKFIDQTCFREMRHSLSLSRALKGRIRGLLGQGAERITDGAGWDFRPGHSSGPFGDGTDGRWRSFDEVHADWVAYSTRYPTRQLQPAWFDCHAKR